MSISNRKLALAFYFISLLYTCSKVVYVIGFETTFLNDLIFGNQEADAPEQQQLLQQPLARLPACAHAIVHYCNHTEAHRDNFAAMICLQELHKSLQLVTPACQHAVWLLKYNLTHDSRFEVAANGICGSEFSNQPACDSLLHGRGLRLACLSERLLLAGDRARPDCQSFLSRLTDLTFVTDFLPAGQFIDACLSDIRRHDCGRLSPPGLANNSRTRLHSQAPVVDCLLISNAASSGLGLSCRGAIRRLIQLQSDKFYRSPRLLTACLDDADRLCLQATSQYERGIIECLAHPNQPSSHSLSHDCRLELRRHQGLGSFDYQHRRRFVTACRSDASKLSCSAGRSLDTRFKSSDWLACFGASVRGAVPACRQRTLQLRSALLSDPGGDSDVLNSCVQELASCRSVQQGQHNSKPWLSEIDKILCIARAAAITAVSAAGPAPCRWAVGKLLRSLSRASPFQTAFGQLAAACLDELSDLSVGCIKAGTLEQAQSCLSGQRLSPKCDERLALLLFFQSGSLGNRLGWHVGASSCGQPCISTGLVNGNETSADTAAVSACLYRSLLANELPESCSQRLIRTLIDSGLGGPEFDSRQVVACAVDLWRRRVKSRETSLASLSKEFNGPPVSSACQAIVRPGIVGNGNHSNAVDRAVFDYCHVYAKLHCSDGGSGPDASLPSCLMRLQAQTDMPPTCRAALQHQRILWLVQPRFTAAFADACKASLLAHCGSASDNAAAIRCLSAIVLEDSLAILLAAESPTLSSSGLPAEIVQVRRHRIGASCRRRLFSDLLPPLQQPSDGDVGLPRLRGIIGGEDPELLRRCQRMAFQHCRDIGDKSDNSGASPLLICLGRHLRDAGFDADCRHAVDQLLLPLLPKSAERRLQRLISGDLHSACETEMNSRCREQLLEASRLPVNAAAADAAIVQLSILRCLRSAAAVESTDRQIRPVCRRIVQRHLAEHSIDSLLPAAGWEPNRLLSDCRRVLLAESAGCVADLAAVDTPQAAAAVGASCLRQALSAGVIPASAAACRSAVVELGQQGAGDRANDVHSDTTLVRACAAELRQNCREVSPGAGRLLACLVSLNGSRRLSDDCQARLADRLLLARAAGDVPRLDQQRPQEQLVELPIESGGPVGSAESFYHVTLLSIFWTMTAAAFAFCLGRRLQRIRWRRLCRTCRLV